jgi:hypothetical protein
MKPLLAALAFALTAAPAFAAEPPILLSVKTGSAQVGLLSGVPALDIELASGQVARAYPRQQETRIGWDGEAVSRWVGTVPDIPGSEVSLTQKSGYTVGTIRIGGKRWHLEPDGALLVVNSAELSPCGTVRRNDLSADLLLQSASSRAIASAPATTLSFIDVLAVYDSTAVREAGGIPQIEVKIEDAIARASEAVHNSNAGRPYRLVGIAKLSKDFDPYKPLDLLYSSEVKALRNQLGADLVQGYAADIYAYIHGTDKPPVQVAGLSSGYYDDPDLGYPSVVSYFAMHDTTPAHEFGHNGGADHEEETAYRPKPARPSSFCPPDGSPGWGTIMWSGATRPPGTCTWEKINYFSNPNIPYGWGGHRLGVPGESDNAGVMRATAPKLANFRESKVPPPTPCAPDPEHVCLSGGRFQVSAHWQTLTEAGHAKAVTLTEDTGYFWFFSPQNVEVVFKIVNGCQLNSFYWFFAGGLTDVGVVFTIVDTKTGAMKQYTNIRGYAFLPIQDTIAFGTCP